MLDRVRRPHGFSLIEFLTVLALTGALMGIAIPQLGHWIRQAAVSNAAESIQNGIRLAQAEAVRRNQPVDFVLVSVNADLATTATTAAASTTDGRAWVVTGLEDAVLKIFHRGDIARDAPEANLTSSASSANRLTFNGFGQITDGSGAALAAPAVFDIRNTTEGVKRARCVYITPGGAVKICNPAAKAGSPTACTSLKATACPAP